MRLLLYLLIPFLFIGVKNFYLELKKEIINSKISTGIFTSLMLLYLYSLTK